MKEFNALFSETSLPDISADKGVKISMDKETLNISWDNGNSMDELMNGNRYENFVIPYDQIQHIVISLKPDVPADFQYGPWNQPDRSKITIIHNDPNKVVSNFTSVFECDQQYWILFFEKNISEITSIPILKQPMIKTIVLSEMQDLKLTNSGAYTELISEMKTVIKSGGKIEIYQTYSNASPDIITSLLTIAGLERFLHHYALYI